MRVFCTEVDAQARAESLLVAQKVREYFKEAGHRTAFEEWYKQRYGKKYEWKRVTSP